MIQFNIVLAVRRNFAQPITLYTTYSIFQNYCYIFKTSKYDSYVGFARY
jgi:hypothetical protein